MDYFSPGEYLIADSAYLISIYCVPVIKGSKTYPGGKKSSIAVWHICALAMNMPLAC